MLFSSIFCTRARPYASVAEWSIASDCKSDGLRPTGVQIPPGAPNEKCWHLPVIFYLLVSPCEGFERERVGKREFPVEEGSESSSVGKPWVSKMFIVPPGALPFFSFI